MLALRQWDYWATVYRRVWRGSVISSFLVPVLYLAGIGLGLGHYVASGNATPTLGGVSYLEFIGPGLLATTAMQTAVFECSYPVLANLKWQKVFEAMIATPLRVRDILAGQIGFTAFRLITTCAVLAAVLAVFHAVESVPGTVLAVFAAVLVGLAFATPVVAYTARLESDSPLPLLFRLAIIPMFLFSGAFFPTSQLPDGLRWLAEATPIWHGVELCRDLTLGRAQLLPSLLHIGYLGVFFLVGWWLAQLSLTRRLVR